MLNGVFYIYYEMYIYFDMYYPYLNKSFITKEYHKISINKVYIYDIVTDI